MAVYSAYPTSNFDTSIDAGKAYMYLKYVLPRNEVLPLP